MTRIVVVFSLIVSSSLVSQSQTLQLLTCFEEGQYTLGEEGSNTAKEVCAFMEKHPGSMLKVYGFATQLGSEEANLELSKKRAEAVYAEIAKCQKLNQSNSYVEWLGESLETYDLHYRDAHADYPCVDILVGRRRR